MKKAVTMILSIFFVLATILFILTMAPLAFINGLRVNEFLQP